MAKYYKSQLKIAATEGDWRLPSSPIARTKSIRISYANWGSGHSGREDDDVDVDADGDVEDVDGADVDDNSDDDDEGGREGGKEGRKEGHSLIKI